MKGSRFVLSIVFLLCYIMTPMSTFAKNNDIRDINYILGDYFDEVQILILSGGDSNRPLSANRNSVLSVSDLSTVSKPISLYQNSEALKFKVTLEEIVNIKITKVGEDSPTYINQYLPSSSDDMIIGTSAWSTGYYEVVLINSAGTLLAKGTVNIH